MPQWNLACSVLDDSLIVCVPKEEHEVMLARSYVRAMEFSDGPMRGRVVVGP